MTQNCTMRWHQTGERCVGMPQVVNKIEDTLLEILDGCKTGALEQSPAWRQTGRTGLDGYRIEPPQFTSLTHLVNYFRQTALPNCDVGISPCRNRAH